MKLDKEVKDFFEYINTKKANNISTALSNGAEIVKWFFCKNYEGKDFINIILKVDNHKTLIAEDLEIINNLNPESIGVSTEDNVIYLNIEVRL